jgi:hypothetical protein
MKHYPQISFDYEDIVNNYKLFNWFGLKLKLLPLSYIFI